MSYQGLLPPILGGVLHIASRKLGCVLQCYTGGFCPPILGGSKFAPPFFNFGPGGIAPGWAQVAPLLLIHTACKRNFIYNSVYIKNSARQFQELLHLPNVTFCWWKAVNKSVALCDFSIIVVLLPLEHPVQVIP